MPASRVARVLRAAPALRAALCALAATLVLSACGGSGGGNGLGTSSGTSGGGTTLPDQTGCAYQYNLTQAAVLSGTDPYLSQQWHLNNTGQQGGVAGEDLRALTAWNITRGAGVRIAVIDDAIETLHADLAPNVVADASYSYRTAALGSVYPLPCASDDTHGTAVAGIAAARDGNAIGGAGVAPRASLVGYSALATSTDADINDALNRGLPSNGVYSSSWGSPDDGLVNTVDSGYLAAIDSGIADGRSGKGAVYVFAGGNGGCYSTNLLGHCQTDSTGLDGYLNHRGVIPVCAVDQYGARPAYAESGANLLVCAPTSSTRDSSAITTTAVKSAYRGDFGGTSASTPMVAGVVALMLSANASLTWRDVRRILATTARRVDTTDSGWNSGTGLWFNHKYGFGVVNASAAVSAARTWTTVGGNDTLKSCGPYTRTPQIALPDANGALVTAREDSVLVARADCAITEIEYVEVAFTATHAYSGDLRVRLLSPASLTSELVSERICAGSGDACGAYTDWRFGSVRHLGESPLGTWKLQVTDAVSTHTGTWSGWALRIWGR